MTFPNPLPWIAYNGVELANAARTMAYIQTKQPQASGVFDLPDVFPCGVLYREIGGTAFGKPETDPAPWYHSDFPESADFLGFVPATILGLDSVITRGVTPRFGGIEGGQLGGEHQEPRAISVRGHLIATSIAGNEYGLRWLANQFSATVCDDCAKGPLQLRTSCPPEDASNDNAGKYWIYDVGLTAGPHDSNEQPGVPSTICDIREIEFVLTAENPYLYRPPITLLPPTLLGGSNSCSDICSWLFGAPAQGPVAAFANPPSIGELGFVITINSPDGIGGVGIRLYADCSHGIFPLGIGNPFRVIYVESVPAGGVLVIDSAQEKVLLTATDPVTNQVVTTDGTGQLTIDNVPLSTAPGAGLLQWPLVAACDPAKCLQAQVLHPCSGGAQTTISIQSQIREK